PLPVAGATVRYGDRWDPDASRSLFPELGPADFPQPDTVVDFDCDGLRPFPDGSVDFVVASHVLEHVADPLRLLDEIHRVLRPGGIAILLLPDRRMTFDSSRAPTRLDHLVAEHAAGVTEVSAEHIEDFVRHAEGRTEPLSTAQLDLHGRRLCDVPCWPEAELPAVLEYAVVRMAQGWQFLDGLPTGAPGSNGIEFGFVLRKEPLCEGAEARFRADRQAWLDDSASLQARVDELTARVAAMEGSTSWRVTAPLRWLT